MKIAPICSISAISQRGARRIMASIIKREWIDDIGRPQIRFDAYVGRKGFRRQSKTFKTRTAANRWAKLVDAELEKGFFKTTDLAERITLGEAIQRYVDEELPRMKSREQNKSQAKTLTRHLGSYPLIALDNHVLSEYQRKRLSMNARNVRSYKDGRVEIIELPRKISSATVRHEMSFLSRVISCAIKKWGVHLPSGNPVRLVQLPSPGKGRDRRMTSEEEARLFSVLNTSHDTVRQRNPYMRAVVIFALETASRRSEIVHLLWSDVDLNRRTAKLRDTKNGEDRSIGLSSRCVEVLMSIPRTKDERVFPLSTNAVRLAWHRALKQAGITGLRFHDLRHEATSRFAVKFNGDLLAMSAMTGHKSLQMLKRYTHLKAEELALRLG